jgi:hypothetical protein
MRELLTRTRFRPANSAKAVIFTGSRPEVPGQRDSAPRGHRSERKEHPRLGDARGRVRLPRCANCRWSRRKKQWTPWPSLSCVDSMRKDSPLAGSRISRSERVAACVRHSHTPSRSAAAVRARLSDSPRPVWSRNRLEAVIADHRLRGTHSWASRVSSDRGKSCPLSSCNPARTRGHHDCSSDRFTAGPPGTFRPRHEDGVRARV